MSECLTWRDTFFIHRSNSLTPVAMCLSNRLLNARFLLAVEYFLKKDLAFAASSFFYLGDVIGIERMTRVCKITRLEKSPSPMKKAVHKRTVWRRVDGHKCVERECRDVCDHLHHELWGLSVIGARWWKHEKQTALFSAQLVYGIYHTKKGVSLAPSPARLAFGLWKT